MIKLIKRLFEKRLLSRSNVCGVGIGYKIKNGETTDELSVIVTVDKKLELKQLSDKDRVPKKLLGILQTDVVDVGKLEPLNWKGKYRPVRVGGSCSWEGLTACSKGLPIWDKDNPEDELGYTLANNHCISAEGRAKTGDAVLSPSPADGGTIRDKEGEVTEMNFPVNSSNEDNIDMSIYKNTIESAMIDVEGNDYIPETRYLTEKDLLKDIVGGGRTAGKVVTGIAIAVDFTAGVRGREGGKEVIRYHKNCVLSLNKDINGDGAVVYGGDSTSPRKIDNRPLVQTFAGSEVAAVFNQTKKSLDYAETMWGKRFSLTPPKMQEGYVALNSHWATDKKTLVRLNLRSEPRLGNDVIIRTLPKGTVIEIIEYAKYADKYHWLKVRIFDN